MKQRGPIGYGEAVATVNGKVAVRAELKFAVGEFGLKSMVVVIWCLTQESLTISASVLAST